MILTKTFKVGWNSKNKLWYESKGYIFTKYKKEFEVKIEDITHGSRVKVLVKCDECENKKTLVYKSYNRDSPDDYYRCIKCREKKRKQTMIERYGVENPSYSKEFKKNRTETMIGRYGVENAFQLEEFKEKSKKTHLEKYGFMFACQSEKVKNKIKKTMIGRYGVENAFQSEEIKEKSKKTHLEKYGVEYYPQTKEFKEKLKKTMIERYGEVWLNHVPRYNPDSIPFIDLIIEKTGIHFEHALNGGERKFHLYWVDAYNDKYNIILEIDEEQHLSKRQIIKDIKRQKYIEDNFGVTFIRIPWNSKTNKPIDSIDNIVKMIL